ncbi:8631_t:CDS:2, partial [Cetraspora pellucida]
SNEPDSEDESLEVRLKKSVCTSYLISEQDQKVQTFLNDKKCIFAQDTNKLSQTTLTVHKINTSSTTPIKQHPYCAALSICSFIKEEIEKLKVKGLKFNAVTKKDAFSCLMLMTYWKFLGLRLGFQY